MKQITLSQKLRVMSRLHAMGCRDEKAVAAISLEELIIKYEIPTMELKIIAEIKKAVKANSLYSYLQETEAKETLKENSEEENFNG